MATQWHPGVHIPSVIMDEETEGLGLHTPTGEWLRPGDWVVTTDQGEQRVYSNEYVSANFEPDVDPKHKAVA